MSLSELRGLNDVGMGDRCVEKGQFDCICTCIRSERQGKTWIPKFHIECSSCNIRVCSSRDATKRLCRNYAGFTLFPVREVALSYPNTSRIRHIVITYCRKLVLTLFCGYSYDVLWKSVSYFSGWQGTLMDTGTYWTAIS
jgi:hypothetical protein